MDYRDSLSADLPSRRDDEPDGLRDDIVDELADHLACAYRRELLRGADPATARQRVLERFGDPAAVARRLWLDAMRGRIMSQRILVVCCVLLTAVSLAMVFIMWNQVELTRRRLVEMNEPCRGTRRGTRPRLPRRRCSNNWLRSRSRSTSGELSSRGPRS